LERENCGYFDWKFLFVSFWISNSVGGGVADGFPSQLLLIIILLFEAEFEDG